MWRRFDAHQIQEENDESEPVHRRAGRDGKLVIAIVWVLLAALYYAAAVVVVALAIGLYRKRGLLVVCAGLPILAALVYATKFVPILNVLVFIPIVVFPAALWNALTQQ